MIIRLLESSDWPDVWKMIEPVFRAGRTYPTPPDIEEPEARHYWIDTPEATFVAVDNEKIVGTYYLKPNQVGLGSHVCNCGYIVAEDARGRGIASAMCAHSQEEARERGYKAMQFNLVVSTNKASVHLWKKHGFQTVGTLPSAFHDLECGYVDAYVMFKELKKEE
jgi:ribosomal protein S18 acetylase RimI-like enzyme